jgi:CMP-N-acetylneuraminic acid synthetase
MTDNNWHTVALLPMKGHSERVPNKNFKLMNGKPLFMWVLETLLSLDEIDLVVINTDVIDVLAKFPICHDARVVVKSRDYELRGDHISMNLIIESDINEFYGDQYIMTHTTNPLLSKATISAGLTLFNDMSHTGKGDSVFGVSKHQTRFYDKQALPINHDPSKLQRTQDLDPYYEENSCLYIFTRESFSSTGARIGSKPSMLEIPKIESIDIDTREDWDLALIVQNGISVLENVR